MERSYSLIIKPPEEVSEDIQKKSLQSFRLDKIKSTHKFMHLDIVGKY